MKFLADCMLGKLAKWLRLVGFDTEYLNDASDDELIRRAVREDRLLLTKDNNLAGRRMVRSRAFFVSAEGTGSQLRQVLDHFSIRVSDDLTFTRCTVCNEPIERVDKPSIKAEVPPYVYKTQQEFGKCLKCGRIYWRGTHVDHVLAALKENDAPTSDTNTYEDDT
jgi:uncharacterized protein